MIDKVPLIIPTVIIILWIIPAHPEAMSLTLGNTDLFYNIVFVINLSTNKFDLMKKHVICPPFLKTLNGNFDRFHKNLLLLGI